jgi:two-component system NarL family sensor kinase
LREHVERLNGDVEFSLDLPTELPPLPAAVEVATYRIALEAVTNVARHAEATACTVRVSVNGALELEVRDNGRGVPARHSSGVGFASMRERAVELGGVLTVEDDNGHGTRVTAVLPLERR